MKSDINLVSKTKAGEEKPKAVIRLRLVSAVSLASVLLLSILLFVLNFFNSPSQIKNEQDQALAKISSENEKAVKYNLLTERTMSISEILGTRTEYNQLISSLIKDKPADVEANTLLVDSSSINLSLNSSSLLSINDYIKSLIKLSSSSKTFSNLTIDGLSSNSRTGEYTLSIKFFINGPKK